MPTGTRDTERRERIARAAIDVVGRAGVEGLTHRAVAAVAEVPLGSITYYYDTLDDLLEAAIAAAKAVADDRLAELGERLAEEGDLVAELSALLVESTGSRREGTVVEMELYMAALRRPSLRALSHAWDRALPVILERRVDTVTAEALASVIDGLALHSLIRGTPLSAAEVEPVLRRVVG